MNKKARIFVLIQVCMVLLIFCSSKSVSAHQKIQVKVACMERGGRFEKNGHNDWTGYDIKLLEKISAYTGWHYEYVMVDNLEDAKKALSEGTVDLITSVEYENPAGEYLYSSLSNGYSYGGFIVNGDREDLVYDNVQSFTGCRIGYERNSAGEAEYEEALQKMYSANHLQAYGSIELLRQALKTGEIDIMVTNADQMDSSAEKLLYKFQPHQLYFMTVPDKMELLNVVDDALASLIVDAPTYLNELQTEYFPIYKLDELDEEEILYLKSFDSIKVGVPSDRYPISKYDSKSGKCQGMIEDYLAILSKKLGIPIEPVPADQAGKEDVDMFLLATSEEVKYRADIVETTDGFMPAVLYAYVLEGRILKEDDILKIGIPEEIAEIEGVLSGRYPHTNLILYDDIESCLKDVESGQIDGMVHNIYVLNYEKKNHQGHGLEISSKIRIPINYCLGAKPGGRKLISIMNKGMRQISDGEIDQIPAKYINKPDANNIADVIYANRFFLFTVTGILVVLLIFWLLFMQQRERYFRKLKEANEQLKKANSAKTDFLSKMSHEIRTPMNAIIGMTKLAGQEEQIPGAVSAYLGKIEGSSEYLLSLLNDILDMGVIESDKLILHLTWERPSKTLKPCIEMLEPLMREKGINFIYPDFNRDAFSYEYLVDKMRMRQILMNLLNNALKFTPKGGTIELKIENLFRDENNAVDLLTVSDTGCGIDKDNLIKVFEPFEQGDNAYKSAIPGTGLGLAIVSQIADAMGGSVTAESVPEKGSSFMLEFPYTYRKIEESLRQPEKQPEIFLKGIRVLLVEDNPINTEVAQKLLEKKGMIVYNSSDGKAAFDMFRASAENFYDVILMDVRMPVMDGIKATCAIRNLDRNDAKSIPVIAMTADAFDEDIQRTKKAGMNEHLSKPIQPTILYNIIQRYVDRKRSAE